MRAGGAGQASDQCDNKGAVGRDGLLGRRLAGDPVLLPHWRQAAGDPSWLPTWPPVPSAPCDLARPIQLLAVAWQWANGEALLASRVRSARALSRNTGPEYFPRLALPCRASIVGGLSTLVAALPGGPPIDAGCRRSEPIALLTPDTTVLGPSLMPELLDIEFVPMAAPRRARLFCWPVKSWRWAATARGIDEKTKGVTHKGCACRGLHR